jgi:CRP-like cAMP-binding protein
MTGSLHNFVSFYLPDTNVESIVISFQKKAVKKKELLLTPGDRCDFLAFIEQGCFRVFYYDTAGKEIITWFSFAEMIIADMLGFYTDGRAQFYVEALEDSVIHIISKRELELLYKEHPPLSEFGRKFAEEALTILMRRTLALHTKSPEERYMELMQHPYFMQKIPLKFQASYLGITDTSLSRIRSRIR